MSKQWDVIVLGAGGAQAQAMLEAATRGNAVGRWLGVDRAWRPERMEAARNAGLETAQLDVLDDPVALRNLVGQATLVANFVGPYYRTGGTVVDACIDAGTNYLDICDDADATLTLLERDRAAREAGVRVLIGMGSSPGVTNILIRAAVDALGSAAQVDIAWIVDVADVGDAAAEHTWHIFSLVDRDGTRVPVPAWEDLSRRVVEFPPPLGRHTVVELAHPEPMTVPRFLDVEKVTNYGGIAPDDALAVTWALARLGGGSHEQIDIKGHSHDLPTVAGALYRRYREQRTVTPYLGGGLVVDVHTGGDGYRFSSGDKTSMEESTGTPAAAGIVVMLDGEPTTPGVIAPECLSPGRFFAALGRVSRGTGSLTVHRLQGGEAGERLRIRDLLSMTAKVG